MANWMEGYASTDNYTKSYFAELNPNFAAFMLLCEGIRPPTTKFACELGFGYGMSINHHACTQAVSWYGNDYNPEQKNYAQNISSRTKNGAVLTDKSFAQLVEKSDWPKFDFISLHGIWTWMSGTNQQHILDFISKHLSDDGVVYISYNVSPSSLAFDPIRELMKHKYEQGTAKGDKLRARMTETLNYLEEFRKTKPVYLTTSPIVEKRIDRLKNQDHAYLLHEYLNDDWNIESFLSINKKLNEIKLQFGSSANLRNSLTSLNYTKEQISFLQTVSSKPEREYLSDLIWCESFRKDYWVKGPNLISRQEQWEKLSNYKVIQLRPRSDIPKEFEGRAFKASIDNEIYDTVITLIEKSETISIDEIAAALNDKPRDSAIQCVKILLSFGFIGLVMNENYVPLRNHQSAGEDINVVMCHESVKEQNSVTFLCSPKTGCALPLTRNVLLYLDAKRRNNISFEDACMTIVEKALDNNEVFEVRGKKVNSKSQIHGAMMREVGNVIDKFGPILAKHDIVLER